MNDHVTSEPVNSGPVQSVPNQKPGGLQAASSVILNLALAAGVGAGAWWLVTQKPAVKPSDKPAPPAKVDKVVKEDELNTVSLTEDAEKRIGLKTGQVEKKPVRRTRVYGGEVTVPAGRAIIVSAPMNGTLKAVADSDIRAGKQVRNGQPVFQLVPIITPDSRATLSAALAESDGLVNSAREQVDLTKIAYERAKRVKSGGAGSQKTVDEAQTAYQVAQKTLEGVQARQKILKKTLGDAETGQEAPVAINAPEDGILRNITALANQTVPSGAPLFEVIDLSTIWVRVPLPVGDYDAIDHAENAQVGNLAAPAGSPQPAAKPVNAPPSANAVSSTVDVFYELPNSGNKYHPGQRLGVTIPLADSKESLTIPWSALVFDIHGGNWVYEQVASHKYARRRVVVAYTLGKDAVLASGLNAGATIITSGVQEIFGAETGFVK